MVDRVDVAPSPNLPNRIVSAVLGAYAIGERAYYDFMDRHEDDLVLFHASIARVKLARNGGDSFMSGEGLGVPFAPESDAMVPFVVLPGTELASSKPSKITRATKWFFGAFIGEIPAEEV